MSAELTTTPQQNIKALLTGKEFTEQVKTALPKHMTPERFIRVALTATTKVPKLLECTPQSFFKCLLDLSSLGLEPDGRRAHLIPYGNQCTLIIDYKGLIELAKRSGDVAVWRPMTVCEADKFAWKNGEITHEVDFLKPRGKMLAVYSHVKTTDGHDDYEVMTLAECDSIRKRSKAANAGPWVSDYEAMCLKTVMRRHSKRLTLSPEFRDAVEKDGDVIDLTPMVEQRPAIAATILENKKAEELKPESTAESDGAK